MSKKFNQPVPEEIRDRLVHAYADANHAHYVYTCMIDNLMTNGDVRLIGIVPMPHEMYKNLSLDEKEQLTNQRDVAVWHYENYLNEYSEYFTEDYREGVEAIINHIKNKVDTGEKE